MLGLHARRGRRALDGVEAIQLLRVLAPRGVLPHQLVKTRITRSRQKVRVERYDHVRAREVELRNRARHQHRSRDRRVVLDQLRVRIRRRDCLPLPGKSRRSDGRGQEVDPRPILRLRGLGAQTLRELRPLPRFALKGHVLRPVGVIQVQKRSLREGVRRALVVGVFRVPVDLDGTELVRLDQRRHRPGHERMGSGEVIWLAQHQILGRLDVGIDRLVRLLGAPGKTRQGHRRSHQLHETAPRHRVHPLLRRRRKLPLHGRLKLRRPRQARRSSAKSVCPSRPSAPRAPRPASCGALPASCLFWFTPFPCPLIGGRPRSWSDPWACGSCSDPKENVPIRPGW